MEFLWVDGSGHMEVINLHSLLHWLRRLPRIGVDLSGGYGVDPLFAGSG